MRRQALALGAAACLLLSACGAGEAPGELAPTPAPSQTAQTPRPAAQRVFTLPLDPAGSWDPYEGSHSSNLALAPLLYEGLFELDRSFAPQAVLAQSAQPSEDGLTWTIVVRSGVTFSDGTPLTAQVAGEALNAARGEKSLYAARLAGVRRVSWDKEQTLTVTLAAPNARFPALLDVPIARVTKEGIYGTGPYRRDGAALLARQDWWRGLALPATQIPLLEAPDADVLISAFNAGKLSLVAADPTGSDALGYSDSGQVWEYPTTNLLYLGFQCTKGPCRSPEFRRAVSLSLDRSALVDQSLEGHARACTLPVPPEAADYDPALDRALDGDKAQAAGLLDELGYAWGQEGGRMAGRQPLALTLAVNSDNTYKEKLAEAISAALKEQGISVEVKALPWAEYKKALEKGDFDLYLAECRLTGDLDPGALITPGSGVCYGGFRDGALTRDLAAARADGTWGEFYQRWSQLVPVAPLCFKNAQLLTQWGQVTGANPTQGNLFYQLENWTVSER